MVAMKGDNRLTAAKKVNRTGPIKRRRATKVELTPAELVKVFGGDWYGSYGLVPGPGHSDDDRSLKIYDFNGKTYVYSFVDDDWKVCREHLGLDDGDDWRRDRSVAFRPPKWATPTRRVRDLLRTSTSPDLVLDVVAYLQSRRLWPLPQGCALKAHASTAYWEAGDPPRMIGRFPALLAPVVDINDELVTVHVTFLKDGRKLADREPRKLLSGTAGRIGCAVRLVPLDGPVLAVGEGLETCLAFHKLSGLPTWSCLSSGLLGRFQPPPEVERLVVPADHGDAGIKAADKLAAAGIPVEVRLPVREDFAADLEGGK
jgi:hypothetical protein